MEESKNIQSNILTDENNNLIGVVHIKPDEVVKDLNYFIREVALAKGIPLNDDMSIDYYTWASSNASIEILEMQIEAKERWYKHQLEEANKTIEQQKKEIEKVRTKAYNEGYDTGYGVSDHESSVIINNLTQENESLTKDLKEALSIVQNLSKVTVEILKNIKPSSVEDKKAIALLIEKLTI